MNKTNELFLEFVEIVRKLRKECPWDREQTHKSIRHNLIEEAYETVEAIDKDDFEELKKRAWGFIASCRDAFGDG
ncbi:MazG nucleotide pyrophosphohydrolase domain-containing protein [Candidatus Kryptobacter tengchongensis]|uniref:MazG nucleotide pyrophosphohydrolase domain-containing protein n=1 Tax=Kryptobacter tengchongensis TaxID=1643429 RepID=A0A656D7J7_KRYT1|nr:MazG nucleotide pyrophosphohydrolase domain-containing protein [Candidatus Kryptobacter tengchongensis]CUT00427.1 MazG nucleotide pyrophosphohydrolase domain-containing protein [Candidatus Kryptobacter tengchongensis]